MEKLEKLTGHQWIEAIDKRFQPIFKDSNLKYSRLLSNKYNTIDAFIMNALDWSDNYHIQDKYNIKFVEMHGNNKLFDIDFCDKYSKQIKNNNKYIWI